MAVSNKRQPHRVFSPFSDKNLETKKNQTTHVNPVFSGKLIVINKSNGKIVADNDQAKILDKDEILRQISFEEKITTSSYWENCLLLPPGCTYTHDQKNNTDNIKINFPHQESIDSNETPDPFNILLTCIAEEHQRNGHCKIVVRLSGGVDSTCLLLAAIEIAGADNIIAITWTDEKSSSNNDRNAATALCRKLNVKQLLFKFEPHYLFQSIEPGDHLFLHAGMASDKVFEKEREFLNYKLNEDYIVLDGHGGDHLFLDPVPAAAFHDLLRNKNFFQAVKIAAMVAKLSGASLYETMVSERKQRNHENLLRNHFLNVKTPPSLNIEQPKNLSDEHIQAVAQALCQNASSLFSNKQKIKVVYPFTTKRMVDYVLKQNPYDMFNHHEVRVPLKKSVKIKYSDIPLRSDKGHITGAYQRALRLHEEKILSSLRGSWLAKERLINVPNIEKALKRSMMGIGGMEKLLIKVICASLIK